MSTAGQVYCSDCGRLLPYHLASCRQVQVANAAAPATGGPCPECGSIPPLHDRHCPAMPLGTVYREVSSYVPANPWRLIQTAPEGRFVLVRGETNQPDTYATTSWFIINAIFRPAGGTPNWYGPDGMLLAAKNWRPAGWRELDL